MKEENALEIAINGPSTPVPKQSRWKKFVSKINKTNLASFVSESWRKSAMEQLPQDKNLVIGGGFENGKLAVSMRRESEGFVRP